MDKFISDIAFSPSVKAYQQKQGSRDSYKRMAETRDWSDKVTPNVAEYIAQRDSFYLGSVNPEGQPYIQHRGGPAGFLKVLDESTLAFADYSGNKQYITAGNLQTHPKVHLFLMDYANQIRIKIWGEATIEEQNPALLEQVRDPEYGAMPERVIVIKVTAWDRNCPQHITKRFTVQDIKPQFNKLNARIAELEQKLAKYETP